MKLFGMMFAILTSLSLMNAAAAQPGKLSADAAAVAQGNNAFAFDLYARLAAQEGNLFFSPYSISNALAMTYAGARGPTAAEMAGTLHFSQEAAKLHPAWAELIRDLDGGGKKRAFQLNIANALWGQKDYGFLPAFLKTTKDNYSAGLHELDFEKATEQARKTINAWVEKQTQDKIKNLIPEGALAGDTRLVLTNAIYFKAAWLEPFYDKITKKADFKVTADKKVPAWFMHKQDAFPLVQTDTFQMLELPYEGRELSLLVLLPRKAEGLAELEKSLTPARLSEWLGKKKTCLVKVSLPKFKITAEFKLKPVLADMGMRLAFTDRADFSGMSTREKLYIDAVLHKAFVDVHEKGTEAAAATAVIIRPTSAPNYDNATFTADHPFTFLIRENRTGSILFMGRLSNPLQ